MRVVIDELSLGLAPVVVSRLIPVIRTIAGTGTGVLLIEQFATVALGLANHAHIMEGGRIRFSGPATELRAHPELLQSAYLLRGSTGQPAAVPPPPAVIPDLFGPNGRWCVPPTTCSRSPPSRAARVPPFGACDSRAPVYGAGGTRAPSWRLGLVTHRPRKMGPGPHAPHPRRAIRWTESHS